MTSLANTPLAAHLLQPAPTATPQSYLDFDFPLPTQRYVGLLACQRKLRLLARAVGWPGAERVSVGVLGDPLLTSVVSEVVKCTKRAAVPAAVGDKKKGKRVVEEVGDEWEVELIDTG